jgi:hypothetical protein
MILDNFITLHLDLINLKINKKKSRECLNKNCNIEATFNYNKYKELNIRKCIYCSKHKLENMIDIKSKKCIFNNCKIQPIYNYETEKMAIYCKNHKLENMINIKDKKCIFNTCNKIPNYNYENNTNALYCKKHQLNNMIDIKNKKCIFKNCNKQSTFNYINNKNTLYCKNHKLENMIDIKNKKCIFENCNKQPCFNYIYNKNGLYCKTHKLEDMIDIISKRCNSENCDTHIFRKKYKGYCLRCFIYEFPESKIIRDYGTRESKVTEFIKKEFKDLNIKYNNQIDGGCSNHRPDIFIDCLTHSVIIEVDEHQHKGNSKSYTPECEIQRVNELFTSLADRPIIFIRFNPDSYVNSKNKLIKSCFEYTEDKGLPKANKTLQPRLNKLKEEIEKNIKIIPNTNITIIKLFYDGY